MIQTVISKKTFQYVVLLLGMISILSACGEKEKDPNLIQAFEFHKQAMEVRQNAQEQISKLQANTDSLFVATYSSELSTLSDALKEWDEQVVEVPGFEEEHDHSHHDHSGHDHDHDHDHHHHNHSEQELTPEQHLEVQQHLLTEIKELAEKLNSIK